MLVARVLSTEDGNMLRFKLLNINIPRFINCLLLSVLNPYLFRYYYNVILHYIIYYLPVIASKKSDDRLFLTTLNHSHYNWQSII